MSGPPLAYHPQEYQKKSTSCYHHYSMAPRNSSYQDGIAWSMDDTDRHSGFMTHDANDDDGQDEERMPLTTSASREFAISKNRHCSSCSLMRWSVIVTLVITSVVLKMAVTGHFHADQKKKHQASPKTDKGSSRPTIDNTIKTRPDIVYHGDFTDDDGNMSAEAKRAQANADARLARLNHEHTTAVVNPTADLPLCEATILIMRHCEKTGDDHQDSAGNEHCTYLGHQRAAYLATLFDHPGHHQHNHSTISTSTTASLSFARRWPAPVKLFAYKIQRKHGLNFREWETLLPLSDSVGVNITLADHPALADTLFAWLHSGRACRCVTLVSWRHSKLPALAQLLGCGPNQGCPTTYPSETFDLVWQLQFVYKSVGAGQTKAHRARERALLDDDQIIKESDTTLHDSEKAWHVYGTVGRLGFDPLAFGRQSGKYP